MRKSKFLGLPLYPLLVALLVTLAGGVYWWVTSGSENDSSQDHRAATTAAVAALGPAPHSEHANKETRPVAGRVLFQGEPVEGAKVSLVSGPEASGPIAMLTTSDALGRFDFGEQTPQRLIVAASAEQKTPTTLHVDTRDPYGAPPSNQLELVLGPCAHALYGTVRDASGGNVVGAQVSEDVDGAGGATSDRDGHYELCVRSGARIRVSATGYGTLAFRGPWVAGRTPRDIDLVPAATVLGRVFRYDGSPAADAQVSLDSSEVGMIRSARKWVRSDADGRFRLDDVGAGKHRISAFAIDQAVWDPVEIMLRPTETMSEVLLHLQPAASLRGVVVKGGIAVSGAKVRFHRAASRLASEAVFTDEEGQFVLRRVPPGQVAPRVEGHRILSPQSLVLRVNETKDVHIETAPLGSIEGQVLLDGLPVERARVHTEGGPVYRTHQSDKAGTFKLDALPGDTYTIIATSDDLQAQGEVRELVLHEGEAKKNVSLELSMGARVTGLVVDESGTPVPGVTVELHEAGKAKRAFATTSEEGEFAVSPLPDGTYQAIVKRTENAANSLLPARPWQPIVIRAGDDVDGIRLVVRSVTGVIGGAVVDLVGNPVSDAFIRALSEGTGESGWYDAPRAVSDMDGRFTVEKLSKGNYTLEARSPDGREGSTMAETGQKRAVIQLDGVGGIEGELAGFRDQPEVILTAIGRPGDRRRARIDGDEFAVQSIPPGDYVISAFSRSESARAEVSVVSGSTSHVGLEAIEGGLLTGFVREFRSGEPVPDLRCQIVMSADGQLSHRLPNEAWTDAAGRFEFHVAPIDHLGMRVFCRASNGAGHLPLGPFSDGAAALSQDENAMEVVVVGKRGPLAMLGFKFDPGSIFTAVVGMVRPGQPGERAGLRTGDIVTHVDDSSVESLVTSGVDRLIRDRASGSEVRLTLRRDSTEVSAVLTLGKWQ